MTEIPTSRKPGRKVIQDLPMTPHRLAQRTFRARRAERQASMEDKIKQLEEVNSALKAQLLEGHQPAAPPPSVFAALQHLEDPARVFISHYCYFSILLLKDTSPYIAFCAALHQSLPLTGIGVTAQVSRSLNEERQEMRRVMKAKDDRCCEGLIDCSAPIFEQDAEPETPYTYVAGPVAWAYFSPFSSGFISPEQIANSLSAYSNLKFYGSPVRCDTDMGLLISKEAVLSVRDDVVRLATVI